VSGVSRSPPAGVAATTGSVGEEMLEAGGAMILRLDDLSRPRCLVTGGGAVEVDWVGLENTSGTSLRVPILTNLRKSLA
jgi:hypothetical protein